VLQVMVGKSHPTVFNLVEEFKKEEADTAVMIAEIDRGKKIRQPQRKKYERINKRLETLAAAYAEYKDEGRLLEYVEACGHNVGL